MEMICRRTRKAPGSANPATHLNEIQGVSIVIRDALNLFAIESGRAGGVMKFDEFRVLTFDCYGTLIDWETGILAVVRPWMTRAGISASDAEVLGAFGEAESTAEHDLPTAIYPEILRATHARMAKHFGVNFRTTTPPDVDAAELLGKSVGDWPAFADTSDALKRLRRRFKLVVVSNVDRESFARTQKRLGITFDAVVTAEEVGAYKPDPRMFLRAMEVAKTFGAERENILHVGQSLYHDHVPAKKLGLKTVWVQRPSKAGEFGATRSPGVDVKPDLVVHSMRELVEVIEGRKERVSG
jgi:2-haloacid dehalogenase